MCGQALPSAVEASDFGQCVHQTVSTMDGLGDGVAEVPCLIQALGTAGEMEGESLGAAAEVRSVVNELLTASLLASVNALTGPLEAIVPSEMFVGPEREVIDPLWEMVKVVESEKKLTECIEAAEKECALVDQTLLLAIVLVLNEFVDGS